MKVFHDASACPPAKLPSDPTNVDEMLKVCIYRKRAYMDKHLPVL